MNIYIASKDKWLGVVVTNDNNHIFYQRAILSPDQSKGLAVQQGILFMRGNNIPHIKTVNVYSNETIEINPEFYKRYGYSVVNKKPETEIEHQRMLAAETEIEMQTRRNILRCVNDKQRC